MIVRAQGLLFDLDGTLIDSLPAVDRAWSAFALRHGLDPAEVLSKIHGRRSIDSIRDLLPEVDALAEDAWIRERESTDTEGVRAIPGALELLRRLPKSRWCVVTSGTSDVAKARMAAVGLPLPDYAVYGEDVARGKPLPDPFLLGAQRLGFAASDCVGFEDTDAGLYSVRSAGSRAVALGRPPLLNLLPVSVTVDEHGLSLEVPDEAFLPPLTTPTSGLEEPRL